MATMIRVTLEQAYGSKDGWCHMRYGTSDPVIPDAMNSDDYVIDMRTKQPKITPGKPIIYSLHAEHATSVVMPEDAAKHLFGNWDISDENQLGTVPNQELTVAHEKRRLTALWGDYAKRPRDRNVPNDWRSLDNVAPPRVPHVLVEKLNGQLQPVDGFAYRPWERFAWQNDCVDNVWDQFGRRMDQPVPALVGGGMDETTILRLIEAEVQKRLGQGQAKHRAS